MRAPHIGIARALAAAVLLSSLVAAPARGQDAPETDAGATEETGDGATPEQREQARVLFERGVEAFDGSRHAEALELFQQSWDLRPTPLVLYNIAVAERHLERYVDAAEHLALYLEMASDEPARMEMARAELEELYEHVARLRVDAPEGAEIRVNDESIGTAPIGPALVLAPGDYLVEATRVGHEPASRRVQLGAGHDRTVTLEPALPPASVPAPATPEPAETVDVERLTSAPDAPLDDGASSSFWESPIPWIVAGVLLVGAGVGAYLLIADEGETVDGNFDPPVVMALE